MSKFIDSIYSKHYTVRHDHKTLLPMSNTLRESEQGDAMRGMPSQVFGMPVRFIEGLPRDRVYFVWPKSQGERTMEVATIINIGGDTQGSA